MHSPISVDDGRRDTADWSGALFVMMKNAGNIHGDVFSVEKILRIGIVDAV